MKNYVITYLLLFTIALFTGCNSSNQSNKETEEVQEETTDTPPVAETEEYTSEQDDSVDFDINTIPISTADIGDFPFFTAPEGAEYINRAKPIDFDFIVFVTPNKIYEVEGKTFRAHVHKDRKSDREISGRYLIRSFEDAITKAGGVKVFEGKLTKERRDKYAELCTYAGSNGSIDIWNNPIATYVIRRNDGNIYIAMDKGKSNTTSIQIVQEKAFEQTIQKVTADKIAKDLNEKGKSILYINFDVDKSDIKPDGKEVVDQILEALKKETSLQIAIEGHTDNTGDAAHNKKLSDDRAKAVMNALVSGGIDKSRLSAQGFGAEKPLVANDSEENKAKNRRVELVKK
ncbi:OmpA family protein [Sphingobacterium phlebotomi]|uniref:OmpA family protein n=1 Tax=Sphingobacterium phlebotomi TaxID=2605433 RepID=A0A5D4HEN4_9SPHI|nr:OmpA family protein [Sphingobacterium phlebotomi]TYR37290.1 OmpA family protein [Sphingobacterium phlebotomi]